MHRLQEFEASQIKKGIPPFKSGDTVRVHCKIKEGNKERIQIFEGVVISRHNAGVSSSFTVRKVSHGIGVERIFPLHAPFIDRIEVQTVGKVRRSRLYYLRSLSGKKARIAAIDTRGQELLTQTEPPEQRVPAEAVAESAESDSKKPSSEPTGGKKKENPEENKE